MSNNAPSRGRERRLRVTVRIEADVVLAETGDARGLEARFEVVPECLVEPQVPQAASERLAVMVTERALKVMRGEPQYALASPTDPPKAVRERFGRKEGRR